MWGWGQELLYLLSSMSEWHKQLLHAYVQVSLLNAEHSPDLMLLAARAITFLADVMPSACSAIVRHGAVPAFCARLMTIEYIDLAEQSLQVRVFWASLQTHGICYVLSCTHVKGKAASSLDSLAWLRVPVSLLCVLGMISSAHVCCRLTSSLPMSTLQPAASSLPRS